MVYTIVTMDTSIDFAKHKHKLLNTILKKASTNRVLVMVFSDNSDILVYSNLSNCSITFKDIVFHFHYIIYQKAQQSLGF